MIEYTSGSMQVCIAPKTEFALFPLWPTKAEKSTYEQKIIYRLLFMLLVILFPTRVKLDFP